MPDNPITTAVNEIKDEIKDVDLNFLIGLTSPIENILEAFGTVIESVRANMSQRNRNWDDAMVLQMKQDVWTLWRSPFVKAGLLKELPTSWFEEIKKVG